MQSKKSLLKEGLWANNPITRMALGFCSTLAVTNLVKNTLVMCVSVTLVLVLNSVIISALRSRIPDRARMIAYMLITATLVKGIDFFLKLYLPDISEALGAYVALIITNCIIMGRAEAFAAGNTVVSSGIDALSTGLGYSLSLLIIAIIREILGFGTIWGVEIYGEAFSPMQLLSTPPGAFFMLGVFVLVMNTLKGDTE